MTRNIETMKQLLHQAERMRFSPFACLSENAKRVNSEEETLRLSFSEDKHRIINCKSFRRLKHKTQVFLNVQGDHYRTRLSHTLEVEEISTFIARNLGLNEDLTSACALGHDVGHSAFGHAGEKVLETFFDFDFSHNKQSLRVVDVIENLNLTNQVRDGILNHTGKIVPATLETQIVKTADRIAYLHHDIEDSIRSSIIKYEDIPKQLREVFPSLDTITDILSLDMIDSSMGQKEIKMSDAILKPMLELRSFMFKTVYEREEAIEQVEKAQNMIKMICEFYIAYPHKMPEKYVGSIPKWGVKRVVADYVSGMTDKYAIEEYRKIFMPNTIV